MAFRLNVVYVNRYASKFLGDKPVVAVAKPLLDENGYEIPGGVYFDSRELMSMASVGNPELKWLLGGAEVGRMTPSAPLPPFVLRHRQKCQ